MKLTFLGATHEVTGSCSYLEACGKRVLVDYGMEQGRDLYENASIPVPPAQIDYVLVTHAHIDHSGLLPLLYKNGFQGEIHSTTATANLCNIMLRDCAHIQEFEAEWRNRKGKRAGKEPVIPLYTMDDAVGAIGLFHPHDYGHIFELCPGMQIRFTDAGHLLGSSSIEIWISEGEINKKIVFSGDIGNINQPLLRNPQSISEADYVVIESTYGDREHAAPKDYAAELAKVLQDTFDRGGNVVIPSFAVGRTQELLYFIRDIKVKGLVTGHGDFPVYIDSPLAIEATNIFNTNASSCFDEEAMALLCKGINPIHFDSLKIAVSVEESVAINTTPGSKVIISASGMCDAGRIKHHLKHNLWKEENTILFVGYQAVGTLGRALVDGAKKVKLFGEDIFVEANVMQLPGISGHGDCNELIRWVKNFAPKPERVFVNHGESSVCELFAKRLSEEFGLLSYAPYSGTRFDLVENRCEYEAQPVPAAREETVREAQQPKAFDHLMTAVERLYSLMKRSAGRPNKELLRTADQLNKICDSWER